MIGMAAVQLKAIEALSPSEGETLSKLSFADFLASGGSRNFKPPKPLQVVLVSFEY